MLKIVVNVILGLAAALLLIGVIGEKDERKCQNVTIAFVTVCALIFGLNKWLM